MDATVTAVFRFALDLSVKATFLFGVTGLVLLAMRRRPASARHFVGTLGLSAALLFPLLSPLLPRLEVPLLPAPTAAAPAGERWPAEPEAIGAPAAGVAEAGAPATDLAGDAAVRAFAEPPVAPVAPVEIPPAPSGFAVPPSAMAAALLVWALGAVVLFARLAVGMLRVRRFRQKASPVVDPEWRGLVASLLPVAGARGPVRLLWSDAVPVAVTTGLRRPVLLLPTSAGHWDPPRRRVVVLHELAHVARRDWPALLLAEVAAAVYWFHPLAWILERRLRRDAERAADDRVLGAGTKPSVYAGHLLGIIRALRPDAGRLIPAMGMARPSHFEERLRAILDPGMRRRGLSAGQARAAAALFLTAAAAVAVLQPWAPRAEAALPSDFPELEEARVAPASRSGEPKSQCDRTSRGTAEEPVAEPAPDRRLESVRRAAEEPDAADSGVAGEAPEPERAVDSLGAEDDAASGLVLAGKHAKKGGKSGEAYERGARLHQEGRYEEAIAEFEKSFAIGYKPGASAYNAACAAARLGRTDDAFAWLEKAAANGIHDMLGYLDRDEDLESLRDDPRFAQLRRRLREAEAAARQGEAEALLSEFEGLASRFPEGADRLYSLGKQLLDVQRYRLAAQAFRLSAQAGLQTGASLYNTACALSLEGETAAALGALQEALEAGFDDPDLVRRDGDLDAIRSQPRYRDLVAMADALSLSMEPLDEESGETDDHAAVENRAAWGRAAARYETYAAAHPNLGRAWFNLGFARLAAGEAPAAVRAYEKALDLGYREAITMYNIACSYARMGRSDEAFDWLFRSLESGMNDQDHIRHDEDLASLRSDPRFRKALKIAGRKSADS